MGRLTGSSGSCVCRMRGQNRQALGQTCVSCLQCPAGSTKTLITVLCLTERTPHYREALHERHTLPHLQVPAWIPNRVARHVHQECDGVGAAVGRREGISQGGQQSGRAKADIIKAGGGTSRLYSFLSRHLRGSLPVLNPLIVSPFTKGPQCAQSTSISCPAIYVI